MSSNVKPSVLDVPLGAERLRALSLIANRWSLWIVLAIHETAGARFTDLAGEPGLSRRVLTERLRELTDLDLVEARQYQARPPRSRYHLTARGLQVRRLALAAVHVTAGGQLADDPFAPTATAPPSVGGAQSTPIAGGDDPATGATHPADVLLAGDLDEAARIHEATIAPLARYDSQYRTSLVETLETWFASDASVSVAAARLYAHRHTIRYRLDRIRELTGLDVTATEQRERLQLGLRARRVLRDSGRPVDGD